MTGTIWRSRASAWITPNPEAPGGRALELPRRLAWASKYRDGGRPLDFTRLFEERAGAGHRRARRHHHLVERGIGDVLIARENEALLTLEGTRRFEIVGVSILKAERRWR